MDLFFAKETEMEATGASYITGSTIGDDHLLTATWGETPANIRGIPHE
jgi:hypothetical protein